MNDQPAQLQPTVVDPRQQPTQQSGRRLPGWRLWLPLLFQTGLILAVPAQDAYTYATGKPITLQTVPVDPYDLLRGHYQTLSYDISRPDQLKTLPGGDWFTQSQAQSSPFYLVLEAPPAGSSHTPPKPWKPVQVSAKQPANLPANQVAIQGKIDQYDQITYGLETYYMPEAQRTQLNQDISQQVNPQSSSNNQQANQQAFVVDVKVDKTGNAVPISLWVKDRNYKF